MYRRTAGILTLALAVLIAGSAVGMAAPTTSSPDATSCQRGETLGKIAGKPVCLKAGRACNRKLDRQYHRYRFHCHSGRLAHFKAPKPPPPPPGKYVDVGGYRLYIECAGSGSPTVIFEAGQGGAAATSPIPGSGAVRGPVARDFRVCAYDRAGLGASDARPAGTAATGERYADELHALLLGAGIPGPYVLVGPSFGGLVIAAYAMRYPADTGGLVFVDADEPCPQACTTDPPEPATFEVGAANFGGRPVVVLVGEFGLVGDGRAWARRSSNSILVTALGSGHAVISDKPSLVAEATRLVAAAVRSGTTVPPCATSPLPAAGGRCETVG